MNDLLDLEYKNWLCDLKNRYKANQIKAAVKVNFELLKFYWLLGKDIVAKKCESKWGSSFFTNLSQDLKKEIPEAKGFSVTNLGYIKRFYQCFSNYPQLGGELKDDYLNKICSVPWGHLKCILDSCKSDSKKALFYNLFCEF